MKIKLPIDILLILILSLIMLFFVYFDVPSVIRLILGLPFLLFFPGYTLITALFVNKKKMDRLELVVLSFGMSIAVIALIGFGLNYTPWGIRLEPILLSIIIFIVSTSIIALFRRIRTLKINSLFTEYTLRLPLWGSSIFSKLLSIILVASIFGILGVLVYSISVPRIGEKFTEFYILGINGKAEAYPTEFVMDGGKVASVSYSGVSDITSERGKVTIGIVNHEQQETEYSVKMKVDGYQVDIYYDGAIIDYLSQIKLENEQKWQHEIGFAPLHIGDNQRVEIFLFKADNTTPSESLHFWINVKGVGLSKVLDLLNPNFT